MARNAVAGYNFMMRIGAIFAVLAIMCCLTGCTKKPPPKKRWISVHRLEVEVPRSVIVGEEVSAIATWRGGTPPYTIIWQFPATLGIQDGRSATSPDTFPFKISREWANIGSTYYIWASITDANGLSSSSSDRFILVEDPALDNPSLYRATKH